ncbi:MAG: DUF2281 domain-containing protein [Chloroherpetonaceae bacterium]|jgi:hypothetical protein|nr:DUF2281 domain-containing protein [bacterium]
MITREEIINEIENLPDPMVVEVLDFVKFLQRKETLDNYGFTLLSESSLKEEWLSKEEDTAWQNL